MDNYTVISRIGTGAFGEVYKARDNRTRQIVALKTVARHKPRQPETTSYKRELSTLVRLNHINVCLNTIIISFF